MRPVKVALLPTLTVWLLGLVNAAAFAAAGLLLHRIAGGCGGRDDGGGDGGAGRDRQRRAAVFWSANPLLLLVGVAGAHLDVIATCLAVASLAAMGRSRVGAGLLGGAAAAIKLH